jgi:hypothetical protein
MIRKSGYEQTAIHLAEDPFVTVSLKKMWQADQENEEYIGQSSVRSSKTVELYITGAATILSGVAAAYFKVKADDRYQHYLRSGDDALLSQTHRLDTAAGVAIAATQVGLGLFTYFILSQ